MKYKSLGAQALEARSLTHALVLAGVIGWRFDDYVARRMVGGPGLYEPIAELLLLPVAADASLNLPGLERAMERGRCDAVVARHVEHAATQAVDWFVGLWSPKGIVWHDRARAWLSEDGTVCFIDQDRMQAALGVIASGRRRLKVLDALPWSSVGAERAGYARAASAEGC
jgi:hypothetical protein